jgi:hypothetical protein
MALLEPSWTANRRDELAGLGERASRRYQAHFTPDRMSGDYLALYRACLSEIPAA